MIYANWSNEIIDFIYDVIGNIKCNYIGIPHLLCIKNSFVDNKIFTPIVKYNVGIGIGFIITMLVSIFTIANLYNDDLIFSFFISFYGSLLLFTFTVKILANNDKIKYISKAYYIEYFIKYNYKLNKNIMTHIFEFNKIIKNINWHDTQIKDIRVNRILFENVELKYIKFLRVNLFDTKFDSCTFDNVNFKNCTTYGISFKNCTFNNVDLSEINYLSFIFFLKGSNILTFLLTSFTDIKIENKFRIINMSPSQIDDFTLTSLEKFISKKKLKKENFELDDWLEERLFSENK